MSETIASPHFSHQVVAKLWKGRPDKARDPQAGARGPRKRTVGYAEEADRAKHRTSDFGDAVENLCIIRV